MKRPFFQAHCEWSFTFPLFSPFEHRLSGAASRAGQTSQAPQQETEPPALKFALQNVFDQSKTATVHDV